MNQNMHFRGPILIIVGLILYFKNNIKALGIFAIFFILFGRIWIIANHQCTGKRTGVGGYLNLIILIAPT